jgi:hypothetical protein
MRALQEAGTQRQLFDPALNGQIGQLTGVPVHLIDGKWWIEITSGANWDLAGLRIQEELEVGDVKYDKARDLMRIWQGEDGWLEVTGQILQKFGITDEFRLSPAAIASLKAQVEVLEEEQERQQLRYLLSQQQEDDY